MVAVLPSMELHGSPIPDTYFGTYIGDMKESISGMVQTAPWAFAFALFGVSILINTQGGTVLAVMPLGFSLGIPVSVQAVHGLVKKWTHAINLKGNYGTHTLRKTWGYQQRTKYGVGFDVIAKRFNHSDPKTTMTYLGIEDKEVHSILMNEIG